MAGVGSATRPSLASPVITSLPHKGPPAVSSAPAVSQVPVTVCPAVPNPGCIMPPGEGRSRTAQRHREKRALQEQVAALQAVVLQAALAVPSSHPLPSAPSVHLPAPNPAPYPQEQP